MAAPMRRDAVREKSCEYYCIDALMLTETWLYSYGDEAYIAAMTPAGYEFRSFPRTGSREGGIDSTFQNTFQKFYCV